MSQGLGGGRAVQHHFFRISHAGTAVKPDKLERHALICLLNTRQYLTARSMLNEIASHFGYDEVYFSQLLCFEAALLRHLVYLFFQDGQVAAVAGGKADMRRTNHWPI